MMFYAGICISAQINVSGTVIDKEGDEPLTGASVIVKGPDGKIRKFATTNVSGTFGMTVPSLDNCLLEVSMIGFAKKIFSLDSVCFPLKVLMEPGATILNEVKVRAERIREQGDTVIYNVGTFAQKQDRSIGDVINRMPGLSVEKSGKIQYQGEDINKFYIEGSDLLGGKYGIATNSISHEDVSAVEVMENHQPMQVLSGIAFSDKAAINLKLKNKAKATWSFHGDAGGGYSWQPNGAVWDSELFAMAVMPGFQNITTFKTNNIGEDLSVNTTDFFASRRETGLDRYVNISLPGVPSLNRKRTLFNRSALFSSNFLRKLRNSEFKAQIDYSFNRVTSRAVNVTTYFLDDGDQLITENRNGRESSNSISGKFIYEVNRKTTFINNTLQANADWDNVELGMTGSLANKQSATLPDYYVANKYKMIKRFNGKHLVTFKSDNEWESLPQTLLVTGNGNRVREHIGDHALYTNESVAYAFLIKGLSITLEGGLKGYMRSMRSELVGSTSGIDLKEYINTNYFTIYAIPKFEYLVKKLSVILDAPVSLARYTFGKPIASRNELYFSPSLSLNWKPNNRFTAALRGGGGRSPMNLNMILPDYIMTDYRTFKRGVDEFYNSTSQNISANFSFKHIRKGVFANALVMQSWSHNPYMLTQQLSGDYMQYSYNRAKSVGEMFIGVGSIGKTLDFMRGSANINASFNRNKSHLISENKVINSVSKVSSLGAKLSSTPLRWLSFDYSVKFSASRLTMDSVENPMLSTMENTALINFIPNHRWEWRIVAEHYRNELTDGVYKNVFLIDTKLVYKLGKRVELSADLSNVFNYRTYKYTTYAQLSSFESQRWLRGRELLISILIRK